MKKSRTTLSQIQLFNTSRCKSVILEYTFYLSIAKICTVLSYRIVEIFDVFTLNVPFIRFESNRSLESLKTQFILLDSSVETKILIHPTCHLRVNHVIPARISILRVFSFENSSFHSVVSLVDAWNFLEKEERTVAFNIEAFSNRIEINKNTFVNRRFDLQYFLFS